MSIIRNERLKRRALHAGYGSTSLAAATALYFLNYNYVAGKKDADTSLDLHDPDLEAWLSPFLMGSGLLFLVVGLALMRHAFSRNGCNVQ